MSNRLVSCFTSKSLPKAELVSSTGQTLRELHQPAGHAPVRSVLAGIQGGRWRTAVERYRQSGLVLHKKTLPAFTPAGTFVVRLESFFDVPAGLVVVDYDKLTAADARAARTALSLDRHVLAAFLSPSGRGVKVLVAVPALEPHNAALARAARHLDEVLAFDHTHDPNGKSCTRLCFVSYDPDLYYNPAAATLAAPRPPDAATSGRLATDADAANIYEFTRRLAGDYAVGNRNEFLYRLACNCNRRGYSLDAARAVLVDVWLTDPHGLPEEELAVTLANAYRRAHEHNTFPRRTPAPARA